MHQNAALCGNGLTAMKNKAFENIQGRERMLVTSILIISHYVSMLPFEQ